MPTGSPTRPQPKPRRGGLFIAPKALLILSFCFSAARTGANAPIGYGQQMGLSHDTTLVAPPKNKKKRIMVWSLAISRPPYGVWGVARKAELIRASQSCGQ